MLKNFRTYQLAVQFYRECEKTKAPQYLKIQLLRASSSIVLNLAEGSARTTEKDRKRFYGIALASLRECQSILDLLNQNRSWKTSDHLGACLYKLSRSQMKSAPDT